MFGELFNKLPGVSKCASLAGGKRRRHISTKRRRRAGSKCASLAGGKRRRHRSTKRRRHISTKRRRRRNTKHRHRGGGFSGDPSTALRARAGEYQ